MGIFEAEKRLWKEKKSDESVIKRGKFTPEEENILLNSLFE